MVTELWIQNGIPTHYFRMECKHSENGHIFQSTKKVNTLGNITLHLHNSGCFGCVQLFTCPHTEVKTSAKHDRCGMKLCQSCQEFSWWEFLSETSSLPTALLDILLVMISGQWAAIFKWFFNFQKILQQRKETIMQPPCRSLCHTGLVFWPNLSANSSAEREVSRRTVMGAWFGPQRFKVYLCKMMFCKAGYRNRRVLEQSLEGKDKWGITRKDNLFSHLINISCLPLKISVIGVRRL